RTTRIAKPDRPTPGAGRTSDPAGELHPRLDAELGVDLRKVGLDGADADEELGRDLLVRPALGDEAGDAELCLGQALDCRSPPDPGSFGLGPRHPEVGAELIEGIDRDGQ